MGMQQHNKHEKQRIGGIPNLFSFRIALGSQPSFAAWVGWKRNDAMDEFSVVRIAMMGPPTTKA